MGRLFIALGELVVSPQANERDDQFVGTDHAAETPVDFTFVGYRLFPTLFAWLIAPTLFFIFLLLAKNQVFAGLLSLLHVFANAIIVHSRAAMLEPMLEFFAVAMVLIFLLLLKDCANRKRLRIFSWLLGT